MRIAASFFGLILAGIAATSALSQGDATAQSAPTRQSLAELREQARSASARGDALAREAEESRDAAERSARQAAALAARVQQAEAERSIAELQLRTVQRERVRLERDLAERRRPLIGLTGALQRLSRTPPAFALVKPGRVEETVRARALMATILPEIERRSEDLRQKLASIRAIERRESEAASALRTNEAQLLERRRELVALETEQRLSSRRLGSAAAREEERALALAEEARDLDGLLDTLGEDGAVRDRLAALPGPKIRPDQPGTARVAADVSPIPTGTAAPSPFILPANGALVESFGGGSRGLALQVADGASVVAPGKGRVAFAGPYSGYGRIVILQHANGWTSLVTGLGRLDVAVGEDVVAGSSLGIADPRRARVLLELRLAGEPVDPLPYLR